MKVVLLFFVIFSNVTFSQIIVPIEFMQDDSIPDSYKIDISKCRDRLYSRIPADCKIGIHNQMSHVFSCEAAYVVADFLYNGKIYYHQDELTNYLNEVLRKVMPEELKHDTSIVVYLVADGSFNAFIMPTGHLFVNLGLMTELPDEATLAAIMTHELAHYYLHHSLYGYFASESGMLDFGLLGKTDKVMNKYSSKQELSADSLAIRWLRSSDYSIYGIMSCFNIGDMFEKNYQNKIEDVINIKDGDHPSSDMRLAKLSNYYNKYKIDTGSFFLVSEKNFKKYKNDIKPEVLKCLLNDAEYSSCIIRAFKYHLYEPYNVLYLRYLLEAIRRSCYLDATQWSKNFITNYYYENVEINNTHVRKVMQNALFVNPRYDLLGINPNEVENIKAKFYWNGEPKFKTNEEAFNYFYNICQSFKDHESVLTNALSFVEDTSYRNKMLKKYLTFSDAKYKEYARCLLKDSLLQSLQPKKMIVLSDFRGQIRFNNEEVSIQSCIYMDNYFFSALIDSVAKEKGINKSLFLSELKDNDLKKYKIILELQNFSFIPISSKSHKAAIQLLNPEYWQFYKDNGINQIEFLKCIFLEDKKWNKDMSAFKEGQNTNFKQLASEKFHTCFLQCIISQVRMEKNKTSQFAFYNGSRPLAFNDMPKNQLVLEMLNQLSLKDKELVKYDNYIRENKNSRY